MHSNGYLTAASVIAAVLVLTHASLAAAGFAFLGEYEELLVKSLVVLHFQTEAPEMQFPRVAKLGLN